MPSRPPHPHQRGFTLMELLVTIAVLVVMAALVAPSMTDWYRKNQQEGATARIADALAQTRSEALNRNTTVCFTLADAAWTIATQDTPATTLSSQEISTKGDLQITASESKICFGGNGFLKNTGDKTITIAQKADPDRTTQVTISNAGRIHWKTCKSQTDC